ncbi:MAG: hypothetical protein ABJE95_27865 [Byssovorax sp.]
MRRTAMMTTVVTGLLGALSATASAATLEVGPGKMYATPCDAIAAAMPGDLVEVAAGTYTDTCSIAVKGLTLRGVGGRPKIDLSATEHPAGYKGIYVIDADDVTLDNLELTGAHITDDNGANGAGIRIEASNTTVHACYIHDNQNGILAGPGASPSKVTIEYTEFDHNGLGNGCNAGGCTHNLYINHFDEFVFQYNWTHNIANDLPDKGHLLKSRALSNKILYNRITGEGGHDSYAIDLPNGGLSIVVGNLIEKGAAGDNFTLLAYAEEGASNPDQRLFVASNTFVNDADKGTFINVTNGGTLVAHNNIFMGPGTVSTTGALSADNFVGDAKLVNAAMFDYHLQAGSPAIDKGVDPGSADAFSLTPTTEYVHPVKGVPRKSDGMLDLGALEVGTDPSGMGGGSATSSGVTSGGTGAGGASTSGTATATAGAGGGSGGGASGGGSDKGGCGCEVAGHESSSSRYAFVGLGLALAALARKRRDRR